MYYLHVLTEIKLCHVSPQKLTEQKNELKRMTVISVANRHIHLETMRVDDRRLTQVMFDLAYH